MGSWRPLRFPRRGGEAGLNRVCSPDGAATHASVTPAHCPLDGVRPPRELEAPFARAAEGVQTHRQPRRGGPPVLGRNEAPPSPP